MSKYTRIYGIGKHEDEYIQFEADRDVLLHDYDHYEKYVKGCEFCVRNDDRYKAYISKLKSAGYNNCAVFGDVVEKGGDKLKLEMHHGPLFNLFDYCNIVLKYHLVRDDMKSITTYDIGSEVLDCHEKDWIMISMLSKTAHVGAHFSDLFIDIKATIGRVDKFIDHYAEGMSNEHWEMIERYLKACKEADHKTTDQSVFDVADKLKKFK